ncbi:hypothetical protein CAPTEDRAFT_28626, partial [Capitella teleta]
DGSCILLQHVCDGHGDCPLNEDENNCTEVCQPQNTLHKFQCASGECISLAKVCDCFPDCLDGSDEIGSHLQNCIGFGCYGMFTCDISYCLPLRYLCDGIYDCPEGQDEV